MSDIEEIRAFITARYQEEINAKVADLDARGIRQGTMARAMELLPLTCKMLGHVSGSYWVDPLGKYKMLAVKYCEHHDYKPKWFPVASHDSPSAQR